MNEALLKIVHKEVSLPMNQLKKVIELTEEGNTVPFIARYRKEMTGGLDEEQIRAILDSWNYAQALDKRKEEVLRLIEEQGKLTEELSASITNAVKLQEVEDLYRPYKQKRRTRATKAKEKGLEPLAQWLYSCPKEGDVQNEAAKYIDEEKEVAAAEDAIEGAQDIIAEYISDDPDIRKHLRFLTWKEGKLHAEKKAKAEDEKEVFAMYYEYEDQVSKIVPHRVLAVNRGESEEVLRVKIEAPETKVLAWLEKQVIHSRPTVAEPYLTAALEDSFKRLLHPSIERDIRAELNETAEAHAIEIFSQNLKQLLLQPPLKGNVVLGVDPAFRTGCKLAVVDATGKRLYTGVIYPTAPRHETKQAAKTVKEVIAEYGVTMIAIGNGTASRETEQFIAEVMKDIKEEIYYLIVNEAGASVYSASKLAKEEFPDLQVEERSAISIARRLQDPLAELVKIDPKSVGVGQYQHDVTQSKLGDSLTFVVETVVNRVGVNVNTASASLLQYVSGLSKTVALNVVKAREDAGVFTNRKQLKKIPRLGAKTYEQSIGFLRVSNGEEPLDGTAIHPESYDTAKKLLKYLNLTAEDIGTEAAVESVKSLSIEEAAEEFEVGVPTLKDIVDSIQQPGRDPRDEVTKPLLKQDVLSMEDLSPGIELEGTVRNVVDFGAFVDIGVKQDGLVHISKLASKFVKHPMDIVSVGDVVTVWVENVDVNKGRIALTMLEPKK
ncbi:Tex family protein [Alkalicoccus daliensis]|uniref:S1 motif domain-containing protein n=1 Tax=Alkalicoccus daliensis TaxID=745820 RepID=A0A1H0IKJ0_9BACI|nr:Tex family protein [Alkalicoccus daliensis]SDO31994.1 uncharacterized protein SAMN04488053_1116 [Alkalicoccus daliensis]